MWDMLYGICIPSWCIKLFIIICLSLPSVIFLTIKLILFYVNVATLVLLQLLVMSFLPSFTFNIFVSLNLTCLLLAGYNSVVCFYHLKISPFWCRIQPVVQSLSPVQLFETPTDCNSPGFPVLYDLLEFAQTHVHWVSDAIQPSHPLLPASLPALYLSQHQGLFQWFGPLHQMAKKYWSFSISPSNEYSRLISFKIDWLDLLALQGTLKSLLQHHSLKASILWPSAAFMVHLSHLYMTTGKTIALTIWTFVCLVYSHLIIITLDLHFLYCIHFLYASGSLFLCLSFTVCSCFIQIFFTISFYPSGY